MYGIQQILFVYSQFFSLEVYIQNGHSRLGLFYLCLLTTTKWNILKEHNHVFAHAQEFDFLTGGYEFKDAGIDIELPQIC